MALYLEYHMARTFNEPNRVEYLVLKLCLYVIRAGFKCDSNINELQILFEYNLFICINIRFLGRVRFVKLYEPNSSSNSNSNLILKMI